MASVQGTNKAGYKDKLKGHILKEFQGKPSDEDIEAYYVIKVQNAWRARTARVYVSALKQESMCKTHRQTHPTIKLGSGGTDDEIQVIACAACGEGDMSAIIRQKVTRKQYQDVQKLLFWGQTRMTIDDTGDNWNQRFQRALDLPEDSMDEKILKYQALSAINKDFVSSATRYAKTIISEYFLHVKDKSIRARNFGGFAGGQKYLWRGILFKMADGESGPWSGSDEAAAKAAGHDMKSVIHYFDCGVKELRFPLMALIDYRGFRMTAQALLPLGSNSLKYGSSDAGRTVHKDDARMNDLIKLAAEKLNIRGHVVGSSSSPVITSTAELDANRLYSAVDVEGHIGMDGRYYMLDLARAFPPEALSATIHLTDLHENGTSVLVFIPSFHVGDAAVPSKVVMGTIYKAYLHGKFYDILLENGNVIFRHPSEFIRARTLSIFWRLLRPEFVKYRGNNPAAHQASTHTAAIGSKEGMEIVSMISSAVADEAVSKVTNFFDVVAPALAEMSTAVDTAVMRSTKRIDNSHAAAKVAVSVPVLEKSLSAKIVDALYDDFNCDTDGADGNVSSTPMTHDLEYDDFQSAKVGQELDSLIGQKEGGQNTLGSYGAYDDFESVTVNGKVDPDVLLLSDAVVDAEGPLSSDAGSAFSRADPYASARNEEIRLATVKLLEKVIPAAARELCILPLSSLQQLDLTVFLHSRGINMRHLGYLRSCVAASKENFGARLKILVEIISRTLKNLLRDFQRRWMRSEKSTSEEGMLNLITQFLNLVVGSNINSAEFWTDCVVIGMIQRFGRCIWYYKETDSTSLVSLSDAEIAAEIEYLRCSPNVLQSLLPRFLDMMGIVLTSTAMDAFLTDNSPYKFEFMPSDIMEYEPSVKCMHIVNYGIGASLQFEAEKRLSDKSGDARIIARMMTASRNRYAMAQKALPSSFETTSRLQSAHNAMIAQNNNATSSGQTNSNQKNIFLVNVKDAAESSQVGSGINNVGSSYGRGANNAMKEKKKCSIM